MPHRPRAVSLATSSRVLLTAVKVAQALLSINVVVMILVILAREHMGRPKAARWLDWAGLGEPVDI